MAVKRPISPFLSVYKPEITSVFSIFERITGLVLVLVVYFAVILLKLQSLLLSQYWCYSLCYGVFKGSIGGVFIGTLLLFTLLCGVYHVVFGARYIYWERAFSQVTIESIKETTLPMFAGVVLITLIIWLLI
jgi:succinate dehydrogenase / fumarate reductase cytochrome b subunit